VVARDLLTETGSIFVQIGDENVHLVRALLDEIFGRENFFAQINYRSMSPLGQKGLASVYDYILWYAKNKELTKFRPLFVDRPIEDEPEFCYIDEGNTGEYKKLSQDEILRLSQEQKKRVFKRSVLTSSGYTPSCTYDFTFQGNTYSPLSGKSWRTHPDGMENLVKAHRLIVLGYNPYFRQYHADFSLIQMENSWHDTAAGFSEEKIYVVQTSDRVVQRCLLMCTDPGDLVLDPTFGSGTTAYVAEQWGRRWITIDTSRVALTLARTRLMSSRFAYYILSDSPEGIKKETELTGRTPPDYKTEGDIKKGFVYKRVPHITLKSIANNPDIKEGMTREEIDRAISRYADTETLYDQPYEDNKRIRVTGPFTVESLSPHRVFATDEDLPVAETEARKEAGVGQFEAMILDNLKKAGVQNTVKNERLKFDWLEPYAGEWLHAEGEYTEKDGTSCRVAICIGPEHGTVGAELVKQAAKEAVKGVGFDLLVVCGFAFDPHVSEEAKRYGKLTVLVTRMNPDLSMGDELLKTTGAGNLFMVFGEPDVEIRQQKDGKVVVEIKGVDVYDPTTGQIRSSSTDDIACWFIDTDYNEESFFVRYAYFTGADEPYEKLKRALKAEIDEAAWASLYSTVSRPFDLPKTGKIAIKVINHYGDEVLKVYEVS
jgi:adenine-specific DNA-methyltransferase